MFGDFYSYLWVLAGYAKWLLFGGPYLIDTLLKRLRHDWVNRLDKMILPDRRRRIEIGIFFAAIFFAGFFAWRDEHLARNDARHAVARRLTDKEKERLQKAFEGNYNSFPSIPISTISGPEPERYGYDFVLIFENMKYNVLFYPNAIPFDNTDTGIMIGVRDKDHPSDAAKLFTKLLLDAGFRVKQIKLDEHGVKLPVDYDIFIGLPDHE